MRLEEDVGDRAVHDAAAASPPPTEVLRRCIRCSVNTPVKSAATLQ